MDALSSVFAVLFASSFGLFAGMPPLSEDPVLERIAPPDTLVYFSWAGAGKADPKSGNKTEQMLADEEVRVFLDGLYKRWSDSDWLDTLADEEDPKQKEAAKVGMEFLGIIMTSPAAGFISDMTFKEKEPDEEDAAPDEFAPPGPIPGLPDLDLKPLIREVRLSRKRTLAVRALMRFPAIVFQIVNGQPSRHWLHPNDFFCSTTSAPQSGQSPIPVGPCPFVARPFVACPFVACRRPLLRVRVPVVLLLLVLLAVRCLDSGTGISSSSPGSDIDSTTGLDRSMVIGLLLMRCCNNERTWAMSS